MSPVLNTKKLKALYTAMLKCRLAKDRMLRDRPDKASLDSVSPVREEAVLVGAAFDLRAGDCIVPSPQSALAEFVRSQSLGKARAHEPPLEGCAPSAALQIGMGTGLALALQKQPQPCITLALAAIELTFEPTWEEALAFSGARKLPILYVIAHGDDRDLRHAQERVSLPAISVDGSDVVAVYRVMQESMRRAREGHGPTLVEARLGAADPLAFMENYLRARNLWSDAWKNRLIKEFARELDRAAHTANAPRRRKIAS